MTELITRSGAWLLQQASTLPDTVVMKTVAVERGWFETVTGIASAVMTLTLLALTIVLAPAAWSFWRTFRKAQMMIDRVYADVTPLTRHASNIADNVDYITTSIRHDMQQVNATIASANRRLQQAVNLTERRLNEFNALLQVVQQEAEQAFVSTASVVRGVRTGAAAFGDGGLVVDHDADEDDDVGPSDFGGMAHGDDIEADEDADGERHDDAGQRPDRQPPARPRVRPAQRRRG